MSKKIKFESKIPLYDGIVYKLPAIPPENEIENYKKKTKDQKFVRRKFIHPSDFLKLSKEEKLEYLTQEYKWRTEGKWYFINGTPTYYTGHFDFFLNYWYLGADTVDGYAEYRYSQLKWSYFLDFCDNDENTCGGILMCQKRFAKCLSVDTDIPTTTGWKKLSDVHVGDFVFGKDGTPTEVIFESEIMFGKKCFEITFSDNTKVITDDGHKWEVLSAWYKREKVIKTTQEMFDDLSYSNGHPKWNVENCSPVKYEKYDLQIPINILELWSHQENTTYTHPHLRHIRKIDEIKTVPVKCIGIDNVDKLFLCTKSFIPTHNTEMALAHLYNSASTTGRNDNFGIMSTDGKTAKENLMRDRLVRSHKNIYKYLQPKTHEQGSSKDITTIKFVSSTEDDGTLNDSLNNSIFYKPTKVDAFQGHRMKEIFIDEPGSIDEIDFGVAYRTFKQQLVLGKKIYGKIYLPTTLETLTPRSAPSFKKIWYDSDYNEKDLNGRTRSNLYRYFKPYWEGMEGFIDEFGNDMVEDSKNFIENQYNAADDDGKRQLRRQYPPTVEAAFDEVVGNQLEEDVITLLKERRKQLERESKEAPIFCVKLYEKEQDVGFSLTPYNGDDLIIYEHVKPDVLYKVGIDSTNTDNTTGSSKGSKFAFTIVKAFEGIDKINYTVVAEFARRPDKMEDCLMILYMACKLYNRYEGLANGVLPERNVSGASFVATFFRQRQLERLLMKEKGSSLFGFYRTGHVKDTQIIKTNLFLRRYGDRLPSILLIDDLLMVGKQNTDRADSFMGAVTALGDFDKQDGVKKEVYTKKKMTIIIENGKRVTKWIDVVIGPDGKQVNANEPRFNNGKYRRQ